MPLVCEEITEWIEEEVTKPVEEWVERSEEKCKNWPWPLNWACKVVTTLVKVVTWVVEKVGKWVARTVCTFVGAVIALLVGVLTFVYEVLAGIFTWDWGRVFDAFVDLVADLFGFLGTLIRVLLLGDTFDYIIGEYQKGQLRDYVRKLLEGEYDGDLLNDIKDALSVDHGAFGFRIRAKAFRTVIDSHFKSDDANPIPDLLTLHEAGDVDILQLAGYEYESFWNRSRYEPVKKGIYATGGGGRRRLPKPSRSDIETYISSRADQGPEFLIISMREDVLNTKLDTARLVGRDLGLMLRWDTKTKHVSDLQDIILSGDNCCNTDDQVTFLNEVIGRNLKVKDAMGNIIDETDALNDLCEPVAVGVFRFEDLKVNGLGTNLRQSYCIECVDCPGAPGLGPNDDSGTTFKDRIPLTVHSSARFSEVFAI